MTNITTNNLTAIIENDPGTNFIQQVNIDPCSESGCPQDHGFKLTFVPSIPNEDGFATIVITATDAGGATASSSFTLRKQSLAVNPPVVAGIPNEQIQLGVGLGYGPIWFVVSDLDAHGVDDTFDLNGDSTVDVVGISDNHDVVDDFVIPAPLNGLKWSVTVAPKPNAVPGAR